MTRRPEIAPQRVIYGLDLLDISNYVCPKDKTQKSADVSSLIVWSSKNVHGREFLRYI